MATQTDQLTQIALASYNYRDALQTFEIFQTHTFYKRMKETETILDTLLALYWEHYQPTKFKDITRE